MVADLERNVDGPRTDTVRNLSTAVTTQIGTEFDGVKVVVRPAVRRASHLPRVDLCPASDDDGRTGLGVAHDDDEPDTVPNECETPASSRIPAQLTSSNRFGEHWERDVSPGLSKPSPEVVGEGVSPRFAGRSVPLCAP